MRRSLRALVSKFRTSPPKEGEKDRRARRKRFRRTLVVESLEARELLASISWSGLGGDSLWSNPLNWTRNQLPAQGDDVYIDELQRTLPIIYDQEQPLNLRNLTLWESLEVSSGSIHVSGSFTTRSPTLSVIGAGVSFVALQTNAIGNPNLIASGGSISLAGLTSYTTARVTIRATGSTGTISLPDLQSILTPPNSSAGYLDIEAIDGGQVFFPQLTSILDSEAERLWGRKIGVTAKGAGSLIDLPLLQTFEDRERRDNSIWEGTSTITAVEEGTIRAPLLTNISGTQITIDGTGTFPVDQITDLTRSTLILGGRDFAFTSLVNMTQSDLWLHGGTVLSSSSNIDGSSFLVENGTISLPEVMNYKSLEGVESIIRATGSSATINLPNLLRITTSEFANQELGIEAVGGGKILFPNVTSFSDAASGDLLGRRIKMTSKGSGSFINLPKLQSFEDREPKAKSTLAGTLIREGTSEITAIEGGVIQTPILTRISGTRVTMDRTGFLPFQQITVLTQGGLHLSGRNLVFTSLASIYQSTVSVNEGSFTANTLSNIDGASLLANGGTITIPTARKYASVPETQSIIRATGGTGRIHLANLQSIATSSYIYPHWTYDDEAIGIEALDGGTITFPKVISILETEAQRTEKRWVAMRSTGSGSRIEFPLLQSFEDQDLGWLSGNYSAITAAESGTIHAPLLTKITGTQVYLDSTGVFPTHQITDLTHSWLNLSGRDYAFSALASMTFGKVSMRGGNFTANTLTHFDSSNLEVENGSVTLSALTGYSIINSVSVIQAKGSSATIHFPNLETISNNAERYQLMDIEAIDGGKVLFPKLTSILDEEEGDLEARRIKLISRGTGSLIDLPVLERFEDRDIKTFNYQRVPFDGHSAITAIENGTVHIPLLTSIDGIQITLDTTGVFPFSKLTNLDRSVLTLSGGDFDFTNLTSLFQTSVSITGGNFTANRVTNIDGASLLVSDGSISVPEATSYTISSGTRSAFRATGSPATIILANLQSITTSEAAFQDLNVEAIAGGEIFLPKLTSILDSEEGEFRAKRVRIASRGEGSLIDLPLLRSFEDRDRETVRGTNPVTLKGEDWNGPSALIAIESGSIHAPLLQRISGVDFTMDGSGILPISQITDLVQSTLNLSGRDFVFSYLTNMPESTLSVQGGSVTAVRLTNFDASSLIVVDGLISFPAAKSYTNIGGMKNIFKAHGHSSKIILGNLQSISTSPAARQHLDIDAYYGGEIFLPKLTSILDAEGGDLQSRKVTIISRGDGSFIDIPLLEVFEDRNAELDNVSHRTWDGNSQITTYLRGTIHLGNRTVLHRIQVEMDGESSIRVGTVYLEAGSTLRTRGKLFGNVHNSSGIVGSDSGVPTIFGNYTQSPSGKLGLVMKSGFTYLRVEGKASLSGTLELIRGYVSEYDTYPDYPAVTSEEITGTFDAITEVGETGNELVPKYGPQMVSLWQDSPIEYYELFDTFVYQNTVENQRVYFDVNRVTGGSVLFRIYDPTGELIARRKATSSDPIYRGFGVFNLKTTGPYVFDVYSEPRRATTPGKAPTYDAVITPAPVATYAGTFQQKITGQISSPGAKEVWEFDAPAGVGLRLRLFDTTSHPGKIFRLVAPDGSVLINHEVTSSTRDYILRHPYLTTTSGTYTLTVEESLDRVSDYQFALELELYGPRIIDIQPGSLVRKPLDAIEVAFDSGVDPTTLNSDTISLLGPNGAIPIESVEPLYDHLFRIHFPTQSTNGDYTIRFSPTVANLTGHAMDQNQNGVLGESLDDAYEHHFRISLPDLIAQEITPSGELVLGAPFDLSWQIDNTGKELASGPWTEKIYVSSPSLGTDRLLLGSFTYTENLSPTASPIFRSERIALPMDYSSDEVYFWIEVDTDQQIGESDENNFFRSNSAHSFGEGALTLSVDRTAFFEERSHAGTITLSRLFPTTDEPLVVTLASSNPDKLPLPASVTIPAGSTSIAIPFSTLADGVADGMESIEITAMATGLTTALLTLSVSDIYLPEVRVWKISVEHPSQFTNGGTFGEVRLEVTQGGYLARQELWPTFKFTNGSPDHSLEQVEIDLIVTDEQGNDVTSLFGIIPIPAPGAPASRMIAPLATSDIMFRLLPSREAAPTAATSYFVGGSVRYLIDGQDIESELETALFSVQPLDSLDYHYFLQRDVIGDNPQTDVVEPSEPFTLAVMVRNNGVGEARDLRFETASPRVVENENGLPIDFQIIGTKVNGKELQPSVKANFGKIAAGGIGIAEWLVDSSLQGSFTNYDTRFKSLAPFEDDRFRLLESVHIHELIRTVDASPVDGGDARPDFLVNDSPDPSGLPDTLYLSNGAIMEVGLGSDAIVIGTPTPENLQVAVTATMTEGWTYLSLADPTPASYELIGIQRSDGIMLPGKNFWKTDRTFITGGGAHLFEEKIHLLDYESTGSYTFIFSYIDTIAPELVSLTGVDSSPTAEQIDIIDVTFTERLIDASFNLSNLSLTKNGEGVDLDGVIITHLAGGTYRLSGFSSFTGDDGVYELHVNAAGIEDLAGNSGAGNITLSWTRDSTAPSSNVAPLSATVSATDFTVFWGGEDGDLGSGIASYDVYVSVDDGPFELWQIGTRETSAIFEGAFGKTYSFYSVATDSVGHREIKTPLAEGTTFIVPPIRTDSFIRGRVFEDRNGDGSFSSEESGLAGWRVFIDGDGDGLLGATETLATTDTNGIYRFEGLAAGTYSIVAIHDESWIATAPQNAHFVTVDGEGTVENIDFGSFKLATIAGTVRGDLDRDGVFDDPIPGVIVYVDVNGNGQRDLEDVFDTTDADGRYLLTGLTKGDHIVRLLVPGGLDQVGGATSNLLTVSVSGEELVDSFFSLRRKNVWRNPVHPYDADGDGDISPLDILEMINDINIHGSRKLPLTREPSSGPNFRPVYLDPDDDGHITPLDVLLVVNWINSRPIEQWNDLPPSPEGEGSALMASPTDESVPDSELTADKVDSLFGWMEEEEERELEEELYLLYRSGSSAWPSVQIVANALLQTSKTEQRALLTHRSEISE